MKLKHRYAAAIAAVVTIVPAAVGAALMSTDATYPYNQDEIAISPGTPTAGKSVNVHAWGFRPNSVVEVVLDVEPAVVVTDGVNGSGRSNTKLPIPADAAGERSISVAGEDPDGNPLTLWINVVITP